MAERCLRRVARVLKAQFGRDFAREPGAGAAGGLGFGLVAFLGARLESGFDLFARYANLDKHLRKANLVITGEGSLDRSTLMSKGVGQIARRCRWMKIPCIGLAGVLGSNPQIQKLFTPARALNELTTTAQAIAKPAFWLERLASDAGRKWQSQ